MLTNLVVFSAAIFQYTAAVLAIRVLRVAGRTPVWAIIAILAFLMAIRRSIVLFQSLWLDPPHQPDLLIESVGLVISFLMVVGMALIGPFSLSVLQSRRELRQRTHDLGKRVKELNLFFNVSRLLENPNTPLETLIQRIVERIPYSWQYSDIACAQVVINDRVFATPNFRDSIWRQSSDISAYGKRVGRVTVCYLEKRPESDGGPFLKEEGDLLDALAERLGKVVERKQVEEQVREHQAELAHVSRINTMGGMASGLAHELNQPLCAISSWLQGCIDTVKSGATKTDLLLHALEAAAQQTKRAGDTINHLRQFMSKHDPRRERVDANGIVRQAIGMMEAEARQKGVTLRLDLADKTLPVMADAIQFEQVILNLARNSFDAMIASKTGKRVLTIQTFENERGEAVVAVSDTGQGISSDIIDHLFEPFFTTKKDGMGLGLAIGQSLVEAHGGRIWVTSREGEETTFQFSLPIVEDDQNDEN